MTSNSPYTIVVGIDGSRDSQAALSWAADEAQQRGGRLQLVTAWTKQPMAWFPAVLETAAGGLAVQDSPEEDADTLQAKALKYATDRGITVTGQVVHTHSAASAILDASRDADLIVIGSRGHGGFPGLHLGSVSTQILNHASGPVLVVRPKNPKTAAGTGA